LSEVAGGGGVLALACGFYHDPYQSPFGTVFPGITGADNSLFAANILRWLGGILDLEKHDGNAEVILSTYLDDRKVAGRMLRIPADADPEKLIDCFFEETKSELKTWLKEGILSRLTDGAKSPTP
jgi:hypothetical protein